MLAVLLGVADFDLDAAEGQSESEGHGDDCGRQLRRITIGFLATKCVTLALEMAVVAVSVRGTILDPKPRLVIPYLLYARFGKLHDWLR